MTKHRAAFFLWASATTACALLTNLDALDGDGGVDASDATLDSNQDDAQSNDASDAQTFDADASTLGFCATNGAHTFCDDFDDSSLTARWNAVSSKADAAIFQDDAWSTSPPNSLHASVVTVANGNVSNAAVVSNTYPPSNHITVATDVFVDVALPFCTYVHFIAIEFVNPPPMYASYSVYVQMQASLDSNIVVYAPFADGGPNTTPFDLSETFAGWKHIQIDVDVSSSTLSVFINAANPVVSQSIPSLGVPSSYNVKLGVLGYNCAASTTFDSHYDGVTIDIDASNGD